MVHRRYDVPVDPEAIEVVLPVIIEIPAGNKNKYELDKDTGLLRLDRVLHSAHVRALADVSPHRMAEISRFFIDLEGAGRNRDHRHRPHTRAR